MLRSILTLENTIVQNNFPKKERNIRKKGELLTILGTLVQIYAVLI